MDKSADVDKPELSLRRMVAMRIATVVFPVPGGRIADLANFIGECEHSGQRVKRVRLVEREYIERALRMVSVAPEELPL